MTAAPSPTARAASAADKLPPYLAAASWPAGTVPLARLRLNERESRWELMGDAQVTQLAKRLFPGARNLGAGGCSFPANARAMQDLVWLMQRFPIAAAEGSEGKLEDAKAGAVAHAIRRIEAEGRTTKVGALFKGVPRKYQDEALAFIMANKKVLLADDMGLGKTVVACMLLASGAGFPAVIVVQPHLVGQWEGMLAAFLETEGPNGVRIGTIRGRGTSKEDIRKGRDRLPDADILLMHYGLVAYWKERLLAAGVRTVVFDEAGELRHRDTDKYNACSAIASEAEHVLGLSGTPIYNYGDEIWAVINAIEFHALGPRDDFVREWCTVQGAHHLVRDPRALNAYLRREGLMLRRRKRDVQNELPPKFRSVQRIDADDDAFNEQMAAAVPLLRSYGGADRWTRFRLSGQIGEQARRATGLAKVEGMVAFLSMLLEADQPVVAFAYHHDVVDELKDQLARFNPVCITGRETAKEKDASKAAFIEGRSDLVIVSLRAATGIDGLQTRARVGVVCELDWSPAIHSQAEDRLWRDGQEGDVMIYYLVSSTGSDPDMQAKLGLKIGQSKGVLDDPFETEEERARDIEETKSFVTKLIERLAQDFANDNRRKWIA